MNRLQSLNILNTVEPCCQLELYSTEWTILVKVLILKNSAQVYCGWKVEYVELWTGRLFHMSHRQALRYWTSGYGFEMRQLQVCVNYSVVEWYILHVFWRTAIVAYFLKYADEGRESLSTWGNFISVRPFRRLHLQRLVTRLNIFSRPCNEWMSANIPIRWRITESHFSVWVIVREQPKFVSVIFHPSSPWGVFVLVFFFHSFSPIVIKLGITRLNRTTLTRDHRLQSGIGMNSFDGLTTGWGVSRRCLCAAARFLVFTIHRHNWN